MTARHLALIVASVAVLGMGVYLFAAVRATPATADVTPAKAPPPPPAEDHSAEAQAKDPPQPEGARRSAALPHPVDPPPVAGSGSQVGSQSSYPPGETAPALSSDAISDELKKANPKLDAVMAEANKAYDRGDFDDAKNIAIKVIAKDPTNVRMLRIAVSAACIDGDASEAQKHYVALPPADKEQMRVRCTRYGISLPQ